MNGFVVVDASLALKWLLVEEHSEKEAGLASLWRREGTSLVAPYLMPPEVANGLYRRVLEQELTLQEATRLMNNLFNTEIELRELPSMHSRAMEIARQVNVGAVYDSHYLPLAEALSCDFWTADQRIYRAANRTTGNIRWVGEFGETPA